MPSGKTNYWTYEEFGQIGSWEDLEIGQTWGPWERTLTDEMANLWLNFWDQWYEPYAVGWAPYNKRLIPGIALIDFYPWAEVPQFRGVAGGLKYANHAPMFVGETYRFTMEIGEKWEKRGRQYFWLEGKGRDLDGNLVHEHSHLQVCQAATKDVNDDLPKMPDLEGMTQEELEEHPYVAPPVPSRKPEFWVREDGYPEPNPGYVTPDWKVGDMLVPESKKFSWHKARDWFSDLNEMYHLFPRQPGYSAELDLKFSAYNLHTNHRAAQQWGLPFANIRGDHMMMVVNDMMWRAFGKGWVVGGFMRCRFIKPGLHLEDFFTANGEIVELVEEEGGTRVKLQVTGQNQRGQTVLAGEASGLIARV